MVSITHLDGADVFVIDAYGRPVPAVDEVRVELDRAVVAVQHDAVGAGWLALASEVMPACAIHSRDGSRLHWHGPVRIVCV